jgi:hypothetical protein
MEIGSVGSVPATPPPPPVVQVSEAPVQQEPMPVAVDESVGQNVDIIA